MKALANRRRLAILAYLKEHREKNVSDIAEHIRLSVKSTSRHLAVLLSADILERDQRSLQAFYQILRKLHPVAKHVITIL